MQVDEGGSRPCGVEGESLVEVWRGGKVLVALEHAPLQKGTPFARRVRPFGGGCALVAYLIGGAQAPSGGLVVSSSSLMQLRVDENQIRSR